MRTRFYHIILLLLVVSTSVHAQAASSHAPSGALSLPASAVQHLLCEQPTDPLGIDARTPRLSWQLSGDQQGLQQIAYEIIVASSQKNLDKDNGDLWHSGKVTSSESRMITYAGNPLQSRSDCF